MLAYNGESSAIMNDDFVLSDLTSINNRNEDDAYQWIQTYTCNGLIEYSNDDDSLEKFLPTNIEFCQNEFEGFFSNANSDLSPVKTESISPPPAQIDYTSYIPIKYNCEDDLSYDQSCRLEFINAPEETYHVRYQSEITSHPLNGNIVNTKKKTKKNISGRYLKGKEGRYVTIALPPLNVLNPNIFVRVTRLTVPYQGNYYIHPYPLLYSTPKKKSQLEVITKDPSIYYKVTKDEICSGMKRFPNMILTRLKQCQLKQIHSLKLFDNIGTMHPFLGESAKNKIALYQLKKSQLDFRIVEYCPHTNDFVDKGISCLTAPLIEEEGTECRKASASSSPILF